MTIIASYEKTMASAKCRQKLDDGTITRSIEEIRQQKATERLDRLAEEAGAFAELSRLISEQRALHDAMAARAEMRALGYFRHSYIEIERRACKLFRVTKNEIRSARRHRDIVFARQFVMYWTVRLTKLSSPQIGRRMGGKDHTSVLHGKKAYRQKRAKQGRYLREVR